jgi:alkylated DNA nucleotide flippase Atl1
MTTRAKLRPTSTRKRGVAQRDTACEPYVKVLTESKSKAFPAGKMLIASPLAVQRIVERVPAGRVITFGALRVALAAQFGTDCTCPVTTGIFLNVAAKAEEGESALGKADVMPWWRVVRDDGALMEKLPVGVGRQAEALGSEGVAIKSVEGSPRRLAQT